MNFDLDKLTPEQREVYDRLDKPSKVVEAVASMAGERVVLDQWQRDLIDTEDPFSIYNKARQVGFSFAVAVRSWIRSYLSKAGAHLGVPVSYNLADAKEKIRYIQHLDKSIPPSERLGRDVWAKTEVEFSNGNRTVTMFMPMGKGPAEVYLDELAHMQEARRIYHAALPMLTRGGKIFIGSTPMAKSGQFYDIWTGAEGKFKKYKHISIPWWRSSALCEDVGEACGTKHRARGMPTAERVERFGTEMVRDIFDNMFLEDFQTEYECKWSDESKAFLPYTLIEACSPIDLEAKDGGGVRQVAGIPELGGLFGDLYAGMDVGRRRDLSEILVGERTGAGRVEGRLWISIPSPNYPSRKFEAQEKICRSILENPRCRKFVIDRNALGEMLAERLKTDFPNKVIDQVLSMKSKPQMAENMRMMMEKGLFQFYPDRDVRQQFHSVKRTVTAHGNVTYDVERNEKHHADKFWAAALMLWGASDQVRGERPRITFIRRPERDPEGFQ